MRPVARGSGLIGRGQAVHIPTQLFQNLLIGQLSQIGSDSALLPPDPSLVQGFLKVADQDRGVRTSRLQVADCGQDHWLAVHPYSLQGQLSRASDRSKRV